jgi:hypothetical protein
LRAAYKLTVRHGPRVERERFASLDSALAALESRLEAIGEDVSAKTVRFLSREFEPVGQVAARAEVAGPRRLRAGVDLRGDGSSEAWTGRWRRALVEQRAGESAYDALRRALRAERRVVDAGGE